MIYNSMRSEFILLLFLFGSFCVTFLFMSIKHGFHNRNQMSSYFKTAFYLSVSVLFAIAFIRTTVPTTAILSILNWTLYGTVAVSSILFLITVSFYIKTKTSYRKQIFSYEYFFDEIDEFVLIFDKNGELAAQNTPVGNAPLFEKKILKLDDLVYALDNLTLYSILKEPVALKIKYNNRDLYVNSSIILKNKQLVVGAVLIFHDITKEQKIITELEEKNQQIMLMNSQLLDEIKIDEALIAQKERERLSVSIQQELDKKMNDVIIDINKMMIQNAHINDEKVLNLRSLTESLRSILSDIRSVVYKSKR